MKNFLFRDNQKKYTKLGKLSHRKFLESMHGLVSNSYKKRYRREVTHPCL